MFPRPRYHDYFPGPEGVALLSNARAVVIADCEYCKVEWNIRLDDRLPDVGRVPDDTRCPECGRRGRVWSY